MTSPRPAGSGSPGPSSGAPAVDPPEAPCANPPLGQSGSTGGGPSGAPGGAPLWLRDLAGAWIFYSVLPAWPWPQPRFARIARFAPWIGALLGGLLALLWAGLQGRVPQLAQVALVLAAGLLLSGGLHMDGVMDTADGLAAGERRLEAMADSRVGAMGVQALVVLLLLRVAGLAALGAAAPLPLLWAAVWARVSPLPAMAFFPYLRPQGSAAFHRRHWSGLARELRPTLLLVLVLLPFSLAAGGGGPTLAGLAGAVPALLTPWLLGRRLGGHSGDSYGACVEWTEAGALLLAALIMGMGAALGLVGAGPAG